MLQSTMNPGTVEISFDHPNLITALSSIDTVDGSEIPNNRLERINLVTSEINYQPQLVFSPDF